MDIRSGVETIWHDLLLSSKNRTEREVWLVFTVSCFFYTYGWLACFWSKCGCHSWQFAPNSTVGFLYGRKIWTDNPCQTGSFCSITPLLTVANSRCQGERLWTGWIGSVLFSHQSAASGLLEMKMKTFCLNSCQYFFLAALYLWDPDLAVSATMNCLMNITSYQKISRFQGLCISHGINLSVCWLYESMPFRYI